MKRPGCRRGGVWLRVMQRNGQQQQDIALHRSAVMDGVSGLQLLP